MTTFEVSGIVGAQILASCNAGTYYVPAMGGGVKVSEEFFEAVKGKTVEVELLTVGQPVKSGRTNKSNFATNEDVFKCNCTVKAKGKESELKLQFSDVVGILGEGGKGNVHFGTFKPEGRDETYLVPVAEKRATSVQVAAYVTANSEVTI